MTDIFESQRHLPSSSSSSTITFVSPTGNDEHHQHQRTNHNNNDSFITIPTYCPVALYRRNTEIQEEEEEEEEVVGGFGFERERKKREREEGDQLSLLTVLVTVFRKSLISCRSVGGVEEHLSSSSSSASMEISWPTNVRHVAHVTFDRFNGFLGLPVEFEPEVPRRPPSARSLHTFSPHFSLISLYMIHGFFFLFLSQFC